MANPLFGGSSLINVDLHYVVEKTVSGDLTPRILSDIEAAKLKSDPKTKDKVFSNRFSFTQLTWAASNRLLEMATQFNFQKNESEINWTRYRDSRLKAVLKEWDCKDEHGNKIPLNEASIDSLLQPIALALIEKYDEALTVSKEEKEKNS